MRSFSIKVAAAILAIGLISNVSGQHTDIEIEVENGVLVTEPRIGEGEFGEAPNPANTADEPGFEADDGMLNAGDVIGFNAVDVLGSNLWHWDGMGSVNFGASANGLSISHPVSGQTALLSSADSGGTGGFTIGVADMVGGMHQDLEFVIDNPIPPSGVYLFGMEITSPNYTSSEPLYMVMASGVDEAVHEAAIDWVADTFSIPEPSSAVMLVGLAMMAMFVGRRRN